MDLEANTAWKADPDFAEPHRRAEIRVAAFMQTFVTSWAARLEPVRAGRGGMDVNRVAEEGIKASATTLSGQGWPSGVTLRSSLVTVPMPEPVSKPRPYARRSSRGWRRR